MTGGIHLSTSFGVIFILSSTEYERGAADGGQMCVFIGCEAKVSVAALR